MITTAKIRKPTTKRTTFKERLAASRTAYLSIPSSLAKGRESELLAQVRRHFPKLRIGSYHTEFEGAADWSENLADFMTGVDMLIVGCDSSRLVGRGILREIAVAKRAGKVIVLFKFDDKQMRRFYGYEHTGTKEKPCVRLRKAAEVAMRSKAPGVPMASLSADRRRSEREPKERTKLKRK